MSIRRLFRIYLFLLGLGSIAVAWYATAAFGAGVGTDGAIQLSTADHLLQGEGFFDYSGEPYLRWPPLYPLALAGLSWLAGVDTFTAGWYLNVFLFGGIVWLGGLLLYECFSDEPGWAFAGGLVIATSVSLLSLTANTGTDPLFIALAWAYLLCAGSYLRGRSRGAQILMAVLACLASLQRLPGVTLVATSAGLILYENRKNWLAGAGKGLLFAATTLLPLVLWGFSRSLVEDSTLFGVYVLEATQPFFNLHNSLVKITHWFVPYSLAERIPTILLAGLPVAALTLVARRQVWLKLGERLARTHIFASLLFAGLYFAFLVSTINSVDTREPFYDRYQVAILAPVLILVFSILQGPTRRFRLARWLGLAVFAVWLVYPVRNLYEYASRSRAEGVITYNKYNTRALRQSKVVRRLQKIGADESQAIYSNYPAAAWFYTRRSVSASPRGLIIDDFQADELVEAYRGWPWDRPGYLVWFLPNEYDHVLEPQDLRRLADLNLVYQGEDGEVYRVRQKD